MTATYDDTGLAALIECIGKTGTVHLDSLQFDVQVVDVRRNWGKIQYKVKPLTGVGEKWLEYPTVRSLR